MYFSMTPSTAMTIHCTFLWNFRYGLLIKIMIHVPCPSVEMSRDNNFRKKKKNYLTN